MYARGPTCEQVLGTENRQHKDCISVENLSPKSSNLRRVCKRKTQSIIVGKKPFKVDFADSLAKEAGHIAVHEGNLKQLYYTTIVLEGKFNSCRYRAAHKRQGRSHYYQCRRSSEEKLKQP